MSDTQAKLARQWAEGAKRAAPRSNYTADTHAAIEFILANTAPSTMEGVMWDNEKHHLAGATNELGKQVVMMWHDETSRFPIVCDGDGYKADSLTPNGKRYELREVTEPDSPATLTTMEDYKNAPEGTVVAGTGKSPIPFCKILGCWCPTIASGAMIEKEMGGVPRHVLRWGWGETDE